MVKRISENIPISKKVVNFIARAMENWRVERVAKRKPLAEVKIPKGIIQRDPLLLQLFVICYCNDVTKLYSKIMLWPWKGSQREQDTTVIV